MPCLNARVVYGWAQEAPPPDYSALFDAARAGNTDPILDHLQSEEGGDLSRVVDGAGNTLLHWAVLVAKPTLVSTLIDQGVDKNALNDQGVTALPINKPCTTESHLQIGTNTCAQCLQ